MKKMKKWILLFSTLFLLSFLLQSMGVQAAKKDTKKPTLTVTDKTKKVTNKDIKVTVKAKDASGISSVKWFSGTKNADFFKSKGTKISLKNGEASVTLKKNGTYTFYAKDKTGNITTKKLTIKNIDKTAPRLKPSSSVMNQRTTIVVNASDSSGIQKISYLKGTIPDVSSKKWEESSKEVSNKKSFSVTASGNYSIMAEDAAGNKSIEVITVTMEMRAIWLSYLEFNDLLKKNQNTITKEAFTSYFSEVVENSVAMNMNTIIVQVRPFGDALYSSKYFPWAECITGEQGKNPGYDPLSIMIEIAHQNGMELHAWINPYRITGAGTSAEKLAANNMAAKWMSSEDEAKQRNVLKYGGKLYYNPSKTEVHNLIVNGVKEIAQNYNVDGIHFDDYFYPSLGSDYTNNFDAQEYNEYKNTCKKNNQTPVDIVQWRRDNVSKMVKKVYSAVKSVDSNLVFGISPQGSINNLYAQTGNYVDVKKWMASDQYIDYICPQIYWSFDHKTAPYAEILDSWIEARTGSNVNIYVGIAGYKAGISQREAGIDYGWGVKTDELKSQVEYARETGSVDGYMFYRYDYMVKPRSTRASEEMQNLISILN